MGGRERERETEIDRQTEKCISYHQTPVVKAGFSSLPLPCATLHVAGFHAHRAHNKIT